MPEAVESRRRWTVDSVVAPLALHFAVVEAADWLEVRPEAVSCLAVFDEEEEALKRKQYYGLFAHFLLKIK